MSNRHLPATVLAILTALALPAIAPAEGSRTISSAPMLNFGQLESGGAHDVDIWRVGLFGGDRITIQAESSDRRLFQLFDPSVNDFSIGQAPAADSGRMREGRAEIELEAPFNGLGSLATCNDTFSECGSQASYPADEPSGAFTFTATVDHATAVTFAPIRRVVRPRTRQRVTARVQSPAGTPTGACRFFTKTSRKPRRDLGVTRLSNGTCSKRARTGRPGKSRFSVQYLPDDGWLASGAATKPILTLKPKRG